MVRGDDVAREAYESEVPRMVAAVAVIWQATLLVQVLAFLHDYRQPAVPIAVWLGLSAAAGWLVPRARTHGLTRGDAALAVAVAVGAGVAIGWDRRAHGAGGAVRKARPPHSCIGATIITSRKAPSTSPPRSIG